jgi:hypothetical protein
MFRRETVSLSPEADDHQDWHACEPSGIPTDPRQAGDRLQRRTHGASMT